MESSTQSTSAKSLLSCDETGTFDDIETEEEMRNTLVGAFANAADPGLEMLWRQFADA